MLHPRRHRPSQMEGLAPAKPRSSRSSTLRLLILLPLLIGCDQMAEQPRYNPYKPSSYYADGTSARPIPAGTVPRGGARTDAHLYQGLVNGQPAPTLPFTMTLNDLARGRDQYEIFCAVYHARTGEGNGMIPMHGLMKPPSYFEPRLVNAPIGHFYDVMTNGYGAMYSYNDRVSVEDRWRIAMYIRALQVSRNVKLSQLSEPERGKLSEGAR